MKTNPNEFIKFHKTLMSNAPEDYIPWYFPVVKNNKAPDGMDISMLAPKDCEGKKGNWKAPWARLTFDAAVERLKQDKNVGIAGRADDDLIIIDIDNYNYFNEMPQTLIVTSRKRCGIHGFCWKRGDCKILPINIPTDFGEIRSSDQYVVVAGSYVETLKEDIEKEPIPDELKEQIKQDSLLGLYTIEKEILPISISFDDLPKFFKDSFITNKNEKPKIKTTPINPNNKHSALFDLKISDIVSISEGSRKAHPLHSSETGMNFSVSNDLAHCWRHLVSLNPIQFLVVKSGYMSCQDAGSSHSGGGAGSSRVTGDYGAIFHAWIQAKKDNLISKDDPMPAKAMIYIAYEHKLIQELSAELLPGYIYNKVLEIVEEKY